MEANEINNNNNETGVNLMSGNNEVTIKSDPTKSRNTIRVKVYADIEENNAFASGYPVLTYNSGGTEQALGGWHKTSPTSGNTYVWYKDITGDSSKSNGLDLGQYVLQYKIIAKDTADPKNSDEEDVNINITVTDNTPPTITSFVATGIPVVNGENVIHLKESEQTIVDVVFTLATTDNGGISEAVVRIQDPVHNIDETLQPTTQGAGSYTFNKRFEYGDFTLGNADQSTLTMQAIVTDTSPGDGLKANSQIISSKLLHTDDNGPDINYKLYVSRNSTVEEIQSNLLFDGDQLVIKSSENSNGQGILYFRARLAATDLRGILHSEVSVIHPVSHPALALTREATGDIQEIEYFTGSLDYDVINNYDSAYTYQFKALARDGQAQETTLTKNISIKKIDDVSPVATLHGTSGLIDDGGTLPVLKMRSDRSGDNVLTVSLLINENTNVLSSGPTLSTVNGENSTVQLVQFPSSGANGEYLYRITLDKSEYAFSNIAEGQTHNQPGKFTTESITINLQDDPNNTPEVIGFPLSFRVEYEDKGNPSVSEVKMSATKDIQQGTTNSFTLNVNVAAANPPPIITIEATLADNETGINPNSCRLIGINNENTQFNAATNKAFFDIRCNSAFYNSLTKYDEEEELSFTILFSDKANNEFQHSGSIKITRVDNDSPLITKWLIADKSEHIMTHFDHLPAAHIDAVLTNEVYEERLQRKYYTTTKNGVLLAGEVDISNDSTFRSVRPPKGSDAWDPDITNEDVYVFTLYVVDVGGLTSTETCTLRIRYVDESSPAINSHRYTDDNNAQISTLVFSTTGESDVTTMERVVFFKANLVDFVDTKDQLEISLNAADAFSGNVVTQVERMDGTNGRDDLEGENDVVYKLTLVSGTYLQSTLQPLTMRLSVKDRSDNTRTVTQAIQVRIDDDQGPVIYSVTSDIIGDTISYPNHVRAVLGNLGYKRVTHQITVRVMDESEVDLVNGIIIKDDEDQQYNIISASLDGERYQGSPSYT